MGHGSLRRCAERALNKPMSWISTKTLCPILIANFSYNVGVFRKIAQKVECSNQYAGDRMAEVVKFLV